MESPFPHHGPLEPDQLRGRTELVADLIERVSGRKVTALLGPRRYGKTSVLRRVASEVSAANVPVVWIDLFELTSLVDLAIRLDDALASTRGPLGRSFGDAAASFGVNLGLVRLEFAKRARPEPVATVHTLLDVAVTHLARAGGVLILDEFSGIANVEGAAGLLRTKLQHHFQQIGLLFAGSEPTTMRSLFSEREQPFYGQADLVTIGPLSQVAVRDIVVDGFEQTGRDPGRLPGFVFAFTSGHPRRVMQLADAAWSRAIPGEDWDDTTWEQALAGVRRSTADANETLFASLPAADRDTLRVVANGGSIWGRAAELVNLSPGSARHALARLRDSGHLSGDDRPALVDPILADWLRRTLPI